MTLKQIGKNPPTYEIFVGDQYFGIVKDDHPQKINSQDFVYTIISITIQDEIARINNEKNSSIG